MSNVVPFAPDLPEPESELDTSAIADIRECGWTCFRVGAEDSDPEADDLVSGSEFMYTAGLSLTHGHAEIILVGAWTAAHAITSAAVRLIESGTTLSPGQEFAGVLPALPVRIGPVGTRARKELLTYADWVNRRQPFDAVQLILPDPAGRWPGDPDYVSFPQHSLA